MPEQDPFRSAFACAPTAALTFDADGRVLAVNTALCTLTGRPSADLVGATLAQLWDDEVRAGGEHTLVRADGRVRRTRWTVGDGFAHVEDVTDREAQAEVLARAQAELEQFAYIASHDLSEPLRTVSGFVRLLARRYEGRLDPDADQFIDYAVMGTERMRGLLEDLLAYSRAGRTAGELVPVELDEVAARVLRDVHPTVEATGAELTVEPLPAVIGDADQLALLLGHLVANALKFTPEGTSARVVVRAERHGHEPVVVVQDAGLGIEPGQVERTFAVFQRLHARDEYGGSGIGLPIARKIVARHGGRIWHEPAPGGGSRFCFSLPATATAPARELPAAA